jgi:phytol kinase
MTMTFQTVSLWVQIAAAAGWLVFVGGLSEVGQRLGWDGEITRKIVHIGAGHVILLAWWLAIPVWVGISASIAFSILTLVSYRLPILPGVNSIGRRSLGTFFYAVSVGCLVGWFWPIHHPYYGVIGILVMCWGDGLAALVGQRWGRHPYELWGERKSLEGSLTMGLASFGVTLIVLSGVQGLSGQSVVVAGVVAIATTLLETCSKLGIDNLTVPLAAAGLAYSCNTLWL